MSIHNLVAIASDALTSGAPVEVSCACFDGWVKIESIQERCEDTLAITPSPAQKPIPMVVFVPNTQFYGVRVSKVIQEGSAKS